jgi:hypothetical protein
MPAQKLAQPPAKLAQTKMSGVERMKPSSQKSWMGASNLFAVCGNAFAGYAVRRLDFILSGQGTSKPDVVQIWC